MSIEYTASPSITTSMEGLTLPSPEIYRDYIALDPRFLYPDQITQFPLYIYHPTRQRLVLFKGAGDIIRQDQLEQLSWGGRHPVFIAQENSEQFRKFLAESLTPLVNDKSLPIEEKVNRFQTLAHSVMQSLFENPPNMQEFISTARNISDTLAQLVIQEPTSIVHLNGLRSYDYYTYSHSMNVCVLGIGLYQQIHSHVPELKLQDLTRGLLLHDIGKCDIPQALTNKPGKLTEEEWSVMKSHPVKGYERLTYDKSLTEDAHKVALLHHEAIDGSGYPHGLTRDHIPLTSRICKVVDVYDALSSNRSYKSRMTPFDTLDLMTSKMKDKLDPEILKEFILFLHNMGKLRS